MSLSQRSSVIKEGDLVILYLSYGSITFAYMDPEKVVNNTHGCFKHESIIGQHFGTKIRSSSAPFGWMTLLHPTPDLWTNVLSMRTQILYLADISMISVVLGLRAGETVFESGTGTGSLTTSLARTVGATGKVYTFEFHPERARLAKIAFKDNGLDMVVGSHCDVLGNGFQIEGTRFQGHHSDFQQPCQVHCL
eukprot:TRINITY_DN44271_c0_g1_i1.p1 TRINITY_DN44271_c0_g1~~TRINITY_DN44271_c0_g1_i1.p1  ORF type:complete len:193 (+),score=24.44 TRINITY_DN44271_c0_g1_i1:21-599(+)